MFTILYEKRPGRHSLGCPFGGCGVGQQGVAVCAEGVEDTPRGRGATVLVGLPTGQCHDRPCRVDAVVSCGRKSRPPRSGAVHPTCRSESSAGPPHPVMVEATDWQVIHGSATSTGNAPCWARHAVVSSNAMVNREPCRAHGITAEHHDEKPLTNDKERSEFIFQSGCRIDLRRRDLRRWGCGWI